ncbi:MAG: hypothetical protein QOF76_3947 [Solirubrobacteraceae bacterium]|nr:hypothetical protein [Solirubrobacteraceae bacterium]
MSFRNRLLLIIALGVVIRIVVVYTTDGVYQDLNSWKLTFFALKAHHFDVYDQLLPGNWPYPPGYFSWVAVAGELTRFVEFERVVRFGAVLADVGIIWLVQDLLKRGGADEQRRLVGAALIAFGPIFVNAAGFNGQLDPAATMVALLAYWVWTRPGQAHRGPLTGALLGVAGSIKTVPLLLAWPVACGSKDRREGASVVAGAIVIFGVIIAPFALPSHSMLSTITGYQGLPGWGGISLLVQPHFAAHVLAGESGVHGSLNTLVDLRDNASLVLVPAIVVMSLFLLWRRPDALTGICLMYLTAYVFGVNFFVSYLIWLMPFLVVRGHFKIVVALQLGLAPAQISVFQGGGVSVAFAYVFYSAAMAIAWVIALGSLGGWMRKLAAGRAPVPA